METRKMAPEVRLVAGNSMETAFEQKTTGAAPATTTCG
jgi:hypothetical protein